MGIAVFFSCCRPAAGENLCLQMFDKVLSTDPQQVCARVERGFWQLLPIVLLILACALLAAAPISAAPLDSRPSGNAKLVRIGTGDWRPYVDESRPDSGALGRLVRAVFEAAGYQVSFAFYPWDRNAMLLQKGSLDAIMPYACSLERQRFSVCSEPLFHGEMVFFHRKDRPFDWKTIEDLKPFNIGTTLGYSYGKAFDQAQKAGQLHTLQAGKEDTNLRLMELRRIDLYPQDRAVGYAMLLRLFPGEARREFIHHPRPLNTESLHLLFRRDDAKGAQLLEVFNTGLRKLAASGELDRMRKALNSGNPNGWVPQ